MAVTLGDPRGIGPEVTAKALDPACYPPLDADFVFIGADDLLAGMPPLAGAELSRLGQWRGGAGDPDPTMPTARGRAVRAGTLAARGVETAARMALAGDVDAIVTAPIEKHATRLAGVPFPGHTEWLAHLAGDVDVAMMLAAGPLRVVLVTTHVALKDVPMLLTTERVVRTGRVTAAALQCWWGIAAPRLALCALNPHAGEQGLFGDEERRVLAPAAAELGATGPLPADTVFVRALRGEFDAVLAPYHDVGMTAIKVAAFGKGVNVTLGLPFPRTSPDHGTAFDIAGQGVADPGSMREALELAVELGGKKVRGETQRREQ